MNCRRPNDPFPVCRRYCDGLLRGGDRSTVLEAIHRAEITGCPVAGPVMSQVGSNVGDRYSYAGYPAFPH